MKNSRILPLVRDTGDKGYSTGEKLSKHQPVENDARNAKYSALFDKLYGSSMYFTRLIIGFWMLLKNSNPKE